MEHKMLWGTLAVGGAGWLCLLLLASLSGARPNSTPVTAPLCDTESRSFHWLSLALPVAVWLATLPTKAPFSSGQGWGRGFLLGGLIAALSCFVVLGEGKIANKGRHFALTSLFGALVIACVPVIWMRYAIIEGLLGAALGWCAVSLLWACAPHRERDALERGASSGVALGLLNGSTFATALCSLTELGVYRDFSITTGPRAFSPTALVLAASMSLSLLFAALLNQAGRQNNPSLSRLFQLATTFLCVIVPLGLGFLLSTRVVDDLKLVYCLGTGAVLAVLGWGLLWDATRREKEGLQQAIAAVSPLALLVALCAFMLAYSFLQGYGVGLMLLAAWPVSLLLWPSNEDQEDQQEEKPSTLPFDVAQTASLLGAFLGVLLLSRVFATRFRTDLRGSDLINQFALFGFLAGAILPTWLASLWFGQSTIHSHPIASPLPLIGIALLSLLLPGAMLAIWGVKVLPAFFAGLALALAGWGGAGAPARACVVALFAQALALALTQWTQKFLPLAEASRAQRTHFLLWGLGSSIVLVLFIDVATRLLLWFQKRQNTGASGNSPTPEVSP